METSCPICFEDLEGKVTASPNTCDHVFCLQCIEKWSKLGGFCPVDRKRFKCIVNLDSEDSIQIKPKKRKKEKILYDFSTKCEVCLKGNHAEVLLLCDCCDLAFHLFCLKPPLKKVPAGLWFCPTCISVESKLKKKNGISKEVEADLGNAALQLKEIKKDHAIQKIPTEEKVQDSAEDSNNKDRRSVSEQCSSIAEACINAASEFETINVENKYYQDIFSGSDLCTNAKQKETESSSKCLKNVKIYGKHKRKPQKYSSVQNAMCKSRELQRANIGDACLENKTSKNDSLLDDCLSRAIIYGDMKIDIGEESYGTTLDKSTNKKRVQECTYKSSNYVKFRKNIPGISSPSHSHSLKDISNENCQQFSSNVNLSKQKKQENAGHRGASSVNILPSCSSISAESDKGTFKNLISDLCDESYFERPGNEIFEGKTREGHLKERDIQFSVFERIECTNASQKKSSEINSRACISFTPNLNVGHCFSCKDMILAASQNYCKICELKYMKNFIRNETNSKSTKSSNLPQEFNSSCMISSSKNNSNFQYPGNTRVVKRSASERRQYSLLRKLQKIHNAHKKKLIDTQK